MKKKTIYISILFAAVLLSCNKKKPLPQEEVTDPVFYVDCNVQGAAMRLEAGRNNYYMNSSFYQDSTNVYVFKGELKQTNCSNDCGYSISFLIRDNQASALGGTMNVNNALKPGAYLLSNQIIAGTQQTVSFSPLHLDAGDSYTWTVTDGATTDAAVNSYSVTKTLKVGKTYSVSLHFESASGACMTSLTNVFKAGSPLQTSIKCQRNLINPDIFTYNFNTLNFTGPAVDTYSYEWDMGDGTKEYIQNPQHTYASAGTYLTELRVTDNTTGETCRSYYQCNVTNGQTCHANFKASFLPVNNTVNPYSVAILLTDPSGKVYSSSDLSVQPQDANFEIVSVEEYKTNENNQPTKQLKIRFNCTVKNGSSAININNGEAVIAVAYK